MNTEYYSEEEEEQSQQESAEESGSENEVRYITQKPWENSINFFIFRNL